MTSRVENLKFRQHSCPANQKDVDRYLRSIQIGRADSVIGADATGWHFVDTELEHPDGAYTLSRGFGFCPWCGQGLPGHVPGFERDPDNVPRL